MAPQIFTRPTSSVNCISSRTWGAGRPHVGLCPIFLVVILLFIILFCGSYWLYWLYGLHLLSCFLSVSLYYCGLTIVLLKKSWFWSTAHRPRAQGKSVNRANTAFYLWQFWLRELFSGTNRETLKSQVTISAWWRSSSGVELSIKRSWVRFDPRPRSSQGT